MSASLLRSRDRPERVVKLIGSDSELGNFILGRESPQGTGAEAARMLLRRIDGVTRASYSNWSSGSGNGSGSAAWGGYAASEWTYRSGVYYPARRQRRTRYGHAEPTRDYADGSGGYAADRSPDYGSPEDEGNDSAGGYTDPQDWGRKFLRTNGACCYIDLNHLEVCTPEVLSARDFVAASRAMLVIARDAMRDASADLSPGERLVVLANNSDGHGQSYGSHLNFLISRGIWRRIFDRMYPDLFVLAAFQASSIVITGQGKVGSENGHEPVDYQLSQRADFIETVQGIQTTFNRPLVNTRDESHCGHSWGSDRASSLNDRYARLHCIFFDHTLCQAATLLKVGTMQLVLAMLEAGHVDAGLVLEDPVAAVHTWSRDPDLAARVPLADGRSLTAVELQRLFLERAKTCAEDPGFGEYVPDSAAILELWEDTLTKLETGSIDSLRSRLDWVLKRDLIEVALNDRPHLDWGSPEVKHLDLIYSSLDEREGLYWACERDGLVEHIVTHAEIHNLTRRPPTDTRAWTRAWLLNALAGGSVQDVDWDHITFAASGTPHGRISRTFQLYDPLGFTKEYLDARLQGSALAVGDERTDQKGNRKPTKRRRQT